MTEVLFLSKMFFFFYIFVLNIFYLRTRLSLLNERRDENVIKTRMVQNYTFFCENFSRR